MLKFVVTGILAAAALAGLFASQDKKDKTLYDRMGGIHTIAQLVDEVVEVSLTNEDLMANPKIKEGFAKQPKSVQKFLVTLLVCDATGGPFKYQGRTLKQIHHGLNITEKEWNALGGDFKRTLDKLKVGEQEQKEILDLMGAWKKDIIEPTKD